MERNVELLNQVMDFIEEHPENHEQSYIWHQGSTPKMLERVLRKTECGSTGCFAGWAVHFGMPGREQIPIARLSIAEHLLGLTFMESVWMFDSRRTQAELRAFVDRVTAEEEAKRVAGEDRVVEQPARYVCSFPAAPEEVEEEEKELVLV